MADFLSLHWGERIVGVEASVSDRRIRVRTTLTAERSRTVDQDSTSDVDVEEPGDSGSGSTGLANALSAAGVSARQAFVVLSQKDVVTRWLELPAVPDEELPEMVRWQAGTKSTVSIDQLVVDYLPLPVVEDAETRSVLLTTVTRETVSEIQQELSEAGLQLRGIGVGGLAVADLALQLTAGHANSDGLVIAADSKQLEVTVHQKGLTVLTHSASLSSESDPVRAAGQAISRALFAASNSVTDLKLDSAVLLGSLGADLEEIVRGRLVRGESDSKVDVVSLTDSQLVEFRSAPAEDLAGCPALAAAIGGLLTATGQVADSVNFLDPHRPPPPKRRVSNQLLVGVAAGVLLLVGLVYFVRMMGSRALNEEITQLEKDVAAERLKFFGPKPSETKSKIPSTVAVDLWQKQRVQWLDQLHELSPLFGESDDVILTELQMSQEVRKGLGRISLTGLTNDRAPVARMTSQIRGHQNYNVRPAELDPNKDRQAEYKYRFSKVNIFVDKKAPAPNDGGGPGPATSGQAEQVDTGKAGS